MPETTQLAVFISDSFHSVWTFELLLFLKDNADTSWQNDGLVQALRSSHAIVSASVEGLLAGGLILADNKGARYAPASADLRLLVEEAHQLYVRKPDAVRRLIVSSRTSGLSAFAESFRLRRD